MPMVPFAARWIRCQLVQRSERVNLGMVREDENALWRTWCSPTWLGLQDLHLVEDGCHIACWRMGSMSQYSGMPAASYSANLSPRSRPRLSGETISTTRSAGPDRWESVRRSRCSVATKELRERHRRLGEGLWDGWQGGRHVATSRCPGQTGGTCVR